MRTHVAVGDIHGAVTKVGTAGEQKVGDERVVKREGQSDQGPDDDEQGG